MAGIEPVYILIAVFALGLAAGFAHRALISHNRRRRHSG